MEEHNEVISAEAIAKCQDSDALMRFMTDEEYFLCENYIKTMNLEESVLMINPEEKAPRYKAITIMKQPIVRRFLELRKKEITALLITQEDIILTVHAVIRKCLDPSNVFDNKGRVVGTQIDAKNALKGLEMLGDNKGIFNKTENKNIRSENTSKTEHIIPTEVVKMCIKQLSDGC